MGECHEAKVSKMALVYYPNHPGQRIWNNDENDEPLFVKVKIPCHFGRKDQLDRNRA